MPNSFFSALTYVFPHGAGLSMTRGTPCFHGHGMTTGAVTLAAWGGAGLVLLASAAHRHNRASTNANLARAVTE